MSQGPELSVIIPVSERADEVERLLSTYREALDTVGKSYEVVFVLDGPFPQIRKSLEHLAEQHDDMSIVQLGKHFGEATALNAGFTHSRGELVLTLPAYEQVEPNSLSDLFETDTDSDMVLGRRWPRVDSGQQQGRTQLFNRLVTFLTGSRFDDLGCGVRLIRRRVLDEVPVYGDQHRFLPILAERRGFRMTQVDLPQSSADALRQSPPLGAYPRRLLDLLTVFFLVKFTKKPLRFFGLIGSATLTVGLVSLAIVVMQRVFFDMALAERPALLLSSLLAVLGVQLLAIGLVGEIVIFTHANEMKEYTVEEIVNGPDSE